MTDARSQVAASPERLAALRRLCLLDSEPSPDRWTHLACRVLRTPVALLLLVDEQRQVVISHAGLPERARAELPLDAFYTEQIVAAQRPLAIADARTEPLAAASPLDHSIAFAGVPLITSDGGVLGTLCVVDHQPRAWSQDEIDMLTDFANTIIAEIEQRAELLAHRQVEDALRHSEQRLQALLTGAPVIMFTFDRDGVITMAEGRGLEAINVPPSQLIGQSVYDLYEIDEQKMGIRRALAGEDVTLLLNREIASRLLYYETRLSPLYDAQHEIVGVIGIANDVSPRIQVEQALESTVEQLTLLRRIQVELSESLDLDSVLTIAMDTALRASGAEHGFIGLLEGEQMRLAHAAGSYYRTDVLWETVEGIVGRSLRTQEPELVLDVNADPDFLANIPGVSAQMVIPLVHRDHLIGVLNLETSKPKLFTQAALEFLRTVASHITVAVDNAQLYQVSQQQLIELHLLYMRISELEQLKTDMIRIAAHDLRNPLGVVKASAELLLEDTAIPPDDRAFLESIAGAGRRMLKIITDILSLQRIEAMQQGGNSDEFDFSELTLDVFAGNEARAQEKALAYRLDQIDPAILVSGDAVQIREAMDNLIGNAIKYTPEYGSVQVRLMPDGNRAVFEVEDSGCGVPEDQQARLFQPFFRADNARALQIEGTGLGLHLVKNIVERHGGNMRFHSVLGEGSIFGFDLPLQRSN